MIVELGGNGREENSARINVLSDELNGIAGFADRAFHGETSALDDFSVLMKYSGVSDNNRNSMERKKQRFRQTRRKAVSIERNSEFLEMQMRPPRLNRKCRI